MRLKNFLYLLIFIPFCIGCESTTEPQADGVIMPLAIGNSWDYKITASDSSSSGLKEEITDNHTMSIQTASTISNEKWYALKGFFGPDDSTYFQSKATGAWVFESDTAALVFKYPAQANASYPLPDDNNVITVISTSEVINVPKGKFTCYHYQQKRINSTRFSTVDFYLAPNVGIVKIDRIIRRTNAGESSTERVLFELTNYSLK